MIVGHAARVIPDVAGLAVAGLALGLVGPGQDRPLQRDGQGLRPVRPFHQFGARRVVVQVGEQRGAAHRGGQEVAAGARLDREIQAVDARPPRRRLGPRPGADDVHLVDVLVRPVAVAVAVQHAAAPVLVGGEVGDGLAVRGRDGDAERLLAVGLERPGLVQVHRERVAGLGAVGAQPLQRQFGGVPGRLVQPRHEQEQGHGRGRDRQRPAQAERRQAAREPGAPARLGLLAALLLLKVVQAEAAEREREVAGEEEAEHQARLRAGGQHAGEGDLEGADALQQPEVARRPRPEHLDDEEADEDGADVRQHGRVADLAEDILHFRRPQFHDDPGHAAAEHGPGQEVGGPGGQHPAPAVGAERRHLQAGQQVEADEQRRRQERALGVEQADRRQREGGVMEQPEPEVQAGHGGASAAR